MRFGVGVEKLRGGSAMEQVVLADGRVEAADLVVVGIGVAPRVELAEGAGLNSRRRHHDQREAAQKSVGGLYAAGDVANALRPHYERHLRIEHWANALNQGSSGRC